MVKQDMSIEELRNFKYPNLIAEIMESGYGINRISAFMGHGDTSDTKEMIEAKLRGDDPILCSEAVGIANAFNAKMEYMFSGNLKIRNGEAEAYWRWQKIHKAKAILKIHDELMGKPYLIKFMKQCIELTEEQREKVLQLLQDMQGAS